MKALIERLRTLEALEHDAEAVTEAADALEQQAKQIEDLAAALAEKDEALAEIGALMLCGKKDHLPGRCDKASKIVLKSIALQPHASLVAKIKADAVRDCANDLHKRSFSGAMYRNELMTYADRIEREGK